MDEEQFATLRQWGEGLTTDGREEVKAAGKAILMLADEVERLHVEIWSLRAALDAHQERAAAPAAEDGAVATLAEPRLARLRAYLVNVFRQE